MYVYIVHQKIKNNKKNFFTRVEGEINLFESEGSLFSKKVKYSLNFLIFFLSLIFLSHSQEHKEKHQLCVCEFSQ